MHVFCHTHTNCAASGLSWFSNPIRKKITYFPIVATTATSHDQFSIILLKLFSPVTGWLLDSKERAGKGPLGRKKHFVATTSNYIREHQRSNWHQQNTRSWFFLPEVLPWQRIPLMHLNLSIGSLISSDHSTFFRCLSHVQSRI